MDWYPTLRSHQHFLLTVYKRLICRISSTPKDKWNAHFKNIRFLPLYMLLLLHFELLVCWLVSLSYYHFEDQRETSKIVEISATEINNPCWSQRVNISVSHWYNCSWESSLHLNYGIGMYSSLISTQEFFCTQFHSCQTSVHWHRQMKNFHDIHIYHLLLAQRAGMLKHLPK